MKILNTLEIRVVKLIIIIIATIFTLPRSIHLTVNYKNRLSSPVLCSIQASFEILILLKVKYTKIQHFIDNLLNRNVKVTEISQ